MRVLTLVGKPGCHLCDDMKAVIERILRARPWESGGAVSLTVVDISGNEGLERRYGLEIPVLALNGEAIAKYRVGEEELRIALEEAGRAGRVER